MSWHPPSPHAQQASQQPRKRAPYCTASKRMPTEQDPRSTGSQAQREEWMRERQQVRQALEYEARTRPAISDENLRMAAIEGQREAQLLDEAASEVRRRKKREGVE